MKKYIFLFCLLFANTLGLIAQNCDYQINLKTQEEIDNFSTNHPCTTFSEGIFIMEDTSGAITNLNGLSQITQVGDFLTIRDNDSLTNLTGLENLQETDYLSIKNNGSLEDLSGLENLQISEGLTIESNTSLTNINSLSNLTSLAGGLSIKSCPILENLSGLEALVELGSLTITECEAIVNLEGIGELSKLSILFLDDNESILSLEGLEGIDTIANLYLFEMPNLTSLIALDGVVISGGMTLRELNSLVNLQGLENIGSKISGNLIFSNIPSLSSISSLSNITETGGGVVVGNCDMLSNLHGLHNIEKIGLAFGLSIGGNESLENISALANLDSIMGVFYIDYNPLLTSLDGLENLVHVGRGFTISNNESLNDLTALSGPLNIRNSFRIQGNSSLQSLSGLDSIKHFHATNDTLPLHYFTIENNPQLTDISAISNLEITKAAYVKILGNDSLSLCGQGNICSFLLEGGEHLIGNNAPGCNTAAEVIESCFEGIDYSSAAGNLAGDLNENCVTDIGDPIIRNWLITFDHADYSWTTRTDEEGNYWLPIVGGEWTLNAVSSSPYWTPCFSDTIVYSTALGDTIFTDFTMEPQGDCSYFDWDVSLPNFRICDTTKFTIHYCNEGVLPAEDFIITTHLDSFLTLVDASVPFTIDADGSYSFEVGTVDVFDCGNIYVDVAVDCDTSLLLWEKQCVDVELLAEELCSPDSLWDGSIVRVDGFCENDSIFFNLENIGTGDMSEEAQFRVEIVIDDIVLLHDVDNYQLASGDSTQLSYATEGMGMRLEADQTSGFPIDEPAAVVVPNCEDIANNQLLLFFPHQGDGNPFQETFCSYISSSYDPNIKTAIPQGRTDGGLMEIDKNWPVQYTIQFQNTGNDTAFLVVLRDVLSNNLDLSTLEIGGGSHPFTWDINAARELTFTFENILLPDSTTNETASQGFVTFTIKPKADILPGDSFNNSAAIYFDFNAPIITNTVSHKIRKPIIATSEHLFWCTGSEYEGQFLYQDTTIQLLTEFLEYDSIHFLHFNVVDSISNNVNVEAQIGEYVQSVLIESDTSFTEVYTAQGGCDSIVHYDVSILTTIEEQLDFQDVVIYPVPASDHLFVLNHESNEKQSWTLRNMMGTAVWERTLMENESIGNIKLTNYPKGIYFLEVQTDKSRGSWKVLIH